LTFLLLKQAGFLSFVSEPPPAIIAVPFPVQDPNPTRRRQLRSFAAGQQSSTVNPRTAPLNPRVSSAGRPCGLDAGAQADRLKSPAPQDRCLW
jgi:hypothetical protein